MEAKHTPGPWFVVDYAGTLCIQNGPMYEDKDLLCYDSLWSEEEVLSKEMAEANANLMAAAPEMLEALIELNKAISLVSTGYPPVDRQLEQWKKKTMELIKKATE